MAIGALLTCEDCGCRGQRSSRVWRTPIGWAAYAGRRRVRRRVRIGAPDPSLTPVLGHAIAVTELVDRLDVIEPLGRGDRADQVSAAAGTPAGSCWSGSPRRSWPGRTSWSGWTASVPTRPGRCWPRCLGWPRRPRPGWRGSSPTRSGSGGDRARRCGTPPRWPRWPWWRRRGRRRCARRVTIDLDTTDVEVYGRKKRGVAFNHQGQRVGRPHVATWADTATVLAADLMAGNDDPRRDAAGLLRRALAALPAAARAGRIRLRADAGYFAGAAGPRRPVRRRRVRHRRPTDRAAVAAARRRRRGRLDRRDRHGGRAGRGGRLLPELVARRDPAADPPGPPRRRRTEQVSADPRARRRRTLHPDQRALPLAELADARRRLRLLVHRDQPRRRPPASAPPRSSTGTATAPRSRTCSATPSTGPRCGTCPPDIPRSTGPGCGARCSPPASPAGCTSSPRPLPPTAACSGTASATAKP